MRDYAVRLGTRDEKRQGFPGGYRNVTPRPRPRSGRARHGRKTPRRGAGGPGRPAAPARGTAVATGAARWPWRPCRLTDRGDRLPMAPGRPCRRPATRGASCPRAPAPCAAPRCTSTSRPGAGRTGTPPPWPAARSGCPSAWVPRMSAAYVPCPTAPWVRPAGVPAGPRIVRRRCPGEGVPAPGRCAPERTGGQAGAFAGRRPGVPEGERRGPRGRSEPGRDGLTRRQRPDCRAVQVPVPTLPSTVSPRALW